LVASIIPGTASGWSETDWKTLRTTTRVSLSEDAVGVE
jgi:hypothetical protein